MYGQYKSYIQDELKQIADAGLFKDERVITSPQNDRITVKNGTEVLNMCANNYLGLAQHPEIRQAAQKGMDEWGYGLASVRFICGTQSIHKKLEEKLSCFLETEDTILFPSCFDANGGLYETLLGEEDAVISDELNHASIIDGIRLCKAQRYRYRNNDMASLEEQLIAADKNNARFKLISTDGVFSMDGHIAQLDKICQLADKYQALVHVDDSHSTGFMGVHGKGTHEYRAVLGKIDIITGTLGKALGGASGGFTSGHKEIVALLRQRSRPYLFSNTVAPPVVAGAIKALELLESSTDLRDRLEENTRFFRAGLKEQGLDIIEGEHPIVPVMLYDANVAVEFAERMLKKGVYVVAFSYPVVPMGTARIRTQISAAHTKEDLQLAIDCFGAVKKEMEL